MGRMPRLEDSPRNRTGGDKVGGRSSDHRGDYGGRGSAHGRTQKGGTRLHPLRTGGIGRDGGVGSLERSTRAGRNTEM